MMKTSFSNTLLVVLLLLYLLIDDAQGLKKIRPFSNSAFLSKRRPVKVSRSSDKRTSLLVSEELRGGSSSTPPVIPPNRLPAEEGKTETITFRRDQRGIFDWILNALWLCTVGWNMWAGWFVVGLGLCCTIIGIPAGMQCIKMSFFLLLPFGKSLVYTKKSLTGGVAIFFFNFLWFVTVGWILALQALVNGTLLMLTIVGIPFGWQCYKFAYLCFRPFGINYSALEETTYELQRQSSSVFRIQHVKDT